MPAFDYLNKGQITPDISAAATASSTAVEMRRSGLVVGLYGVAVVSTASTATFQTRVVTITFKYSTDNGTTYRVAGQLELKQLDTSGLPKQIRSVPLGLVDIVPEQNDPANIQWLATYDQGSTIASASDPIIDVYLAQNPGFPAIVD